MREIGAGAWHDVDQTARGQCPRCNPCSHLVLERPKANGDIAELTRFRRTFWRAEKFFEAPQCPGEVFEVADWECDHLSHSADSSRQIVLMFPLGRVAASAGSGWLAVEATCFSAAAPSGSLAS